MPSASPATSLPPVARPIDPTTEGVGMYWQMPVAGSWLRIRRETLSTQYSRSASGSQIGLSPRRSGEGEILVEVTIPGMTPVKWPPRRIRASWRWLALLLHEWAGALRQRTPRIFGGDRAVDFVVIPRCLGLAWLFHFGGQH